MRFNRLTCNALLASAMFFILLPLSGQQYNFRHFDVSRGFPERIVNSVGQDSEGFLWVAGGTGLYRFDGFDFHRVEFPDTSEIRFATTGYRDDSGRFWLGTNDGNVYYATDGGTLNEVPGIEAGFIVDISAGDGGSVYVLTRGEGIFRIDADGSVGVTHYKAPGGLFLFSFLPVGNDTFLAGSDETLLLLRAAEGSLEILQELEGMGYSAVKGVVEHTVDGTYLAANEDGLFFVSYSGEENQYLAERVVSDELSPLSRIESIYRDMQGDFWAATYGSGAVRITFDDDGSTVLRVRFYDTSNGLAGNDVRKVFQDNEGNHWIALFGDGLAQLVSEAFTFYRPGRGDSGNSVIYTGFNGENFFFGTPQGYYLFDLAGEEIIEFESLSGYTKGTQILTYYTDALGVVLFSTEAGELYRGNNRDGYSLFFTGEGGESRIDHISSYGGNLWLATRDGITVINESDGERVTRFTTRNRLPHNRVNQVFIDSEGNAFVASEAAGLYRVDFETGVTPEIMLNGVGRNVIQGITRSADGTYWLATLGNGLFAAGSDSVKLFTTGDGLFSNFCYSILADREGRIWTGHERGFSRYSPRSRQIQTFSTDFADDGNCNPNAIFESEEGVIFIGTTTGVIIYDKRKDMAGESLPFNNIVSVTINDKQYPPGGTINLPYGNYIARVEYAGISLTNPSTIRHRIFMENYDLDWSELTTQRQVTYRLTDGVYRFSMEAVGESGIPVVSENIINIIIKRPFWRSWWFVLLVIAALSGLVMIIIVLRERKQKELTQYLENELQARTIEVVKQKEEIEQQNVEITDSINYARRIQSSILPDEAKLKESFRDAFIIFIPRDIVSGDFYWFERIDEERFVLVCADSTGHGVPGAFMSMIGSTLLQDIITRKGITRPSQVLEMLDQQVFSTLNRNLEVGVSNDGMDVVVCEVNMRNRHVRFASAMRPVIMVMGGEMYYIKGNRSSVGGEAYMEKFFDDQEYYLSEGDSIYLFSDGLPDQFGGEDGKKMKIARLKRLIEGIKEMPMERQKQFISDFYHEWKGDQAQVDDIIFMGIRF